ncbi:MAG: hypothetical protein DHS20C01_05490 [marine bacterium B5-7]|nr:MAG: hypothetical protein DHS20C01_05490 [marine bacterium B5-7]
MKCRHKPRSGVRRWHKLSAHLLTLFLITGVLLVFIITGLFSGVWTSYFEDSVQPHLEQYIEYIGQEIGSSPDVKVAAAIAKRLPLDIVIQTNEGEWSSLDSTFDKAALEPVGHHKNIDGLEIGEYRGDRFYARMTNNGYTLTLLTEPRQRHKRGLFALLVMLALVLTVLTVAYRIIRRMLLPLETLDKAVTHIGQGDLDYRVDVAPRNEIGRLADSINKMAEDISGMLESKRQLLLAISHELRSPLTRANVALALLEPSDTTRALNNDLGEMEQLIADLLEAERLNSRHAILKIEEVEVGDLIRDSICEGFSEQGVSLSISNESSIVRVDRLRVRLLIRNLLANALRHNRPAIGPVKLTGTVINDTLEIEVCDHGEGMSESEIEHAVEPFWRKDNARRRSTGGAGLGLYLCRKIAEAHGGNLTIESVVGVGTSVIAHLIITRSIAGN